MKMAINGMYKGQVVVVDALKGMEAGIKVSVSQNDKLAICDLFPAEAVALADALLGAVKYVTSKL